MKGLFGDIYQVANECLAPIFQDPANRGRSWDRCYSFFQRYHNLNQKQQQENKEIACLHLGFFLASWGMFRGSGFLIQKDYTIYGDVIDLLLDQEYEALWYPDFFQYLLTSNAPILKNSGRFYLIFALAERLRDFISSLMIIRSHRSSPENAQATETIITKILMGTAGCVPAYDTYFKEGLKDCNIHRCGSFSTSSFARLLNICRENNLWTTLQKRPIKYYGVAYPIMRVVDIYFWAKGFNSAQDNH